MESYTDTHTHTPLACFILPTLYFAPFTLLSGLGFSYRWIPCLSPSLFSHLANFLGTPLFQQGTSAPQNNRCPPSLRCTFWKPFGHPRLLILSAFFEPIFTNLDSSSCLYHISVHSILSFLLTLKLNFLELSSLQCQKSSLGACDFCLIPLLGKGKEKKRK